MLRKFITVAMGLSISVSGFSATPVDSTSLQIPTNTQSYVYATAMVTFRISTSNRWSWCYAKNQWVIPFTVCPSNAINAPQLNFDPTAVNNTVCKGAISPVGTSNGTTIYIRPGGNLGATIDPIYCTVPIATWLPNSVFSNVGNSISVSANVLGQKVYVNYQNGTIPYIQPTSTQTYFNVSYLDGSNISGGDNVPLTQALIPGGLQSVSAIFPSCSSPSC